MAMAQYNNPNKANKLFPWPEGKRCAVSLTFDDARRTQISIGIPLLNKHNVKATFYINPNGTRRRLDQWIEAAKQGHEIGNHTISHPCSGNFAFSRNNALEEYTLDKIDTDIENCNQFIQQTLKTNAVSFAYPCGHTFVGRGENLKSYIPLIAKKFQTGRVWLSEDTNDPWVCDFAQLLGMKSDGKSFEELKRLIDKTASEGKWLILAGHEINTQGRLTTLIESLDRLCEYAKNPDNGIWIDTVTNIATYIEEKRTK
jgi:peptidoglycan/xylan/chitin deacetylase (PgdA/CDA1 family)